MRRRGLPLLALVAAVVLCTVAAASRAVLQPRAYAEPNGDLLIVLVIGSDLGPPQRPGDPMRGNADALHLIAVDTVSRRASIVDIPRDSLVEDQKINAYLATGGPRALEERLEAFTGVPIDFWALTSFQGLIELVDGTGPVQVTVDVPMHDPFSGSDFEPGEQRLDGAQALAFSRDRHSMSDGDIGRTRHQGQLLAALHRQLRDRDLPELVELFVAAAPKTVSNIPAEELLPLAKLAAKIRPEAVAQVPLQGQIVTRNGASVVILEPGDAFERLKAGQVGPPEDADSRSALDPSPTSVEEGRETGAEHENCRSQ
jgi:LCP family protein required for cell wall assembly